MISVVVPVYNVRQYIEEFLESLISQTYQELEIILVDDGSTDGSGEICDQYKNKDRRITCIHKSNGGVMSAWKTGFEKTQGKYISFVDPDDILEENMYERMLWTITNFDADIVISGLFYYKDGQREPELDVKVKAGLYTGENLEQIKKVLFGCVENRESFCHFWKPNKLFKRQAIINNYQYNDERISYGDDVCITASAILDAQRLYILGECLYNYRIREGSITRSFSLEKNIDSALFLCNKIVQMLKDKGYYNDFVYYHEQANHITHLIKKISCLHIRWIHKKAFFYILKQHCLVANFNLKEAKKYLSRLSYFAIKLIKSPFYFVFCFKKIPG